MEKFLKEKSEAFLKAKNLKNEIFEEVRNLSKKFEDLRNLVEFLYVNEEFDTYDNEELDDILYDLRNDMEYIEDDLDDLNDVLESLEENLEIFERNLSDFEEEVKSLFKNKNNKILDN